MTTILSNKKIVNCIKTKQMKSKHLIISLICLVLLFFSLYVYVNVIEKGPYDNNQTHILDNQNIGSESNSTQKELYKILHSWSEIFVIEGSGYGTDINEWYFISVENSESSFMRSWGRTYYNNKPFTGTLLKYNSAVSLTTPLNIVSSALLPFKRITSLNIFNPPVELSMNESVPS